MVGVNGCFDQKLYPVEDNKTSMDLDVRRSNDYNSICLNGGFKWSILQSKKHQINGDFL